MNRTIVPALLVMLLAACGQKDAPTAAAPAAASAPAAAPAAPAPVAAADQAHEKAEKIYKGTCIMCHKTGVSGAPIVGNKDDWAPRIAQGEATLHKHAIEGYSGQKGMMPAKGGNPSLSDDDIKAAIGYMVAQSK